MQPEKAQTGLSTIGPWQIFCPFLRAPGCARPMDGRGFAPCLRPAMTSGQKNPGDSRTAMAELFGVTEPPPCKAHAGTTRLRTGGGQGSPRLPRTPVAATHRGGWEGGESRARARLSSPADQSRFDGHVCAKYQHTPPIPAGFFGVIASRRVGAKRRLRPEWGRICNEVLQLSGFCTNGGTSAPIAGR